MGIKSLRIICLFLRFICSHYLVLLIFLLNIYIDCVCVSPAVTLLVCTEKQSNCTSACPLGPLLSSLHSSQSEDLKCISNRIISLLLTLQNHPIALGIKAKLLNVIYSTHQPGSYLHHPLLLYSIFSSPIVIWYSPCYLLPQRLIFKILSSFSHIVNTYISLMSSSGVTSSRKLFLITVIRSTSSI